MRKSVFILKYMAIAAMALLVSICYISRMPQLVVIIGLGAGCVYFIVRKIDKEMRKKIAILFLITFILQVVISLFMHNRTVDTEFYGFSHKDDDYSYGKFGMTVGDLWRRGIFPSLKELDYYNFITMPGGGVQNYQLYNAFIFYLFGASAGQILLIINCFFHAALIIPVYFICRDLDMKSNIMTFVFFLFLFWPSTFYWPLFNFKDPAILFVLILIFAVFTRIRKTPDFLNVVCFFAFSFSAFLLRRYLIIVFPIAALYFFIFKKWKYKKTVALIIVSFLILVGLWTGVFSDLHTKLGSLPARLFRTRFASDEAQSNYFINIATHTYRDTALYFPLGVLATLFLPFLLRPYTLFQIGANIESIFWWLLLPFLISGIWICMRKELKKTFLLLGIFFYWLSILALTQGNMGTLIRQKGIIYYIGFIFIGLAIDRTLHAMETKKHGRERGK